MASATDLLQAAMSETFTSADAGVPRINQAKVVSANKKASLCNKENVYSIKQEVLNGVDINIKKEPLDPVTSANDHVKTKPVVPPGKDKSCGLCASSFTTASNLKSHILSHSGEKDLNCVQCNKSFSRTQNLRRHMLSHIGEKSHKCHHCDYSSTIVDSLRKHIRTHTGERSYECDQCSYSSTLALTLKKHKMVHAQDKPHACSLCNFSCTQKTQLQVHIRRNHTQEKPHKCKTCQYKSTTAAQLKRHIRKHTGEKPFKCAHCIKTFCDKRDFTKHVQIHTTPPLPPPAGPGLAQEVPNICKENMNEGEVAKKGIEEMERYDKLATIKNGDFTKYMNEKLFNNVLKEKEK